MDLTMSIAVAAPQAPPKTKSRAVWLVAAAAFAAGATALPALPALAGRPLVRRAALACVAGAIALPISLPVLPAAALARFPVQKINHDLGEEIGWPSQVKLLARAYDGLPENERAGATVITANYGEAGAADRYGPAFGLPQVSSGTTTSGSGARRRPAIPSPW